MRVTLLLLVTACGARTGLDVLDAAADATRYDAARDAPSDAPVFGFDSGVDAPVMVVSCDAGYFIEVTGDAGTMTLRHGDGPAHVPWETLLDPGAEDCFTQGIQGDDNASTSVEVIPIQCNNVPLAVGTTPASGHRIDAFGFWTGDGTMNVTGVGTSAVTGDYSVTVHLIADDAGHPVNGPSAAAHGAFCVLP